MTTEHYIRMAYDLKKQNPVENGKQTVPAIAQFGLSQTALQDWYQDVEANKVIKQKDYMMEIHNSKRLIAKYAREERLQWEQNLKDKGLWT